MNPGNSHQFYIRVPLYFPRLMGRRSSEEFAAATGVLTGHSGALRSPADDLMIPAPRSRGEQRARLSRESGLDLNRFDSVTHLGGSLGTRPNARLYEYVILSELTAVSQLAVYQFFLHLVKRTISTIRHIVSPPAAAPGRSRSTQSQRRTVARPPCASCPPPSHAAPLLR